MNHSLLIIPGILAILSAGTPQANGAVPPALRGFLDKHCAECHDSDAKKGGLDLTASSFELTRHDEMDLWTRVHDRVLAGEMPPAKKPRPPQATLSDFARTMYEQLHTASLQQQQTAGRVVARRLNRVEWENTIRDLFSIRTDLKSLLPEDTSAGGFDNVAAALDVSSVLMDRYLEALDLALDAALWNHEQPVPLKQRYSYKDISQLKQTFFGKRMLERDDAVVFFMEGGYYPTELRQFTASADGRYRIVVSAYAYQSNKPLPMGVYTGKVIGRNGEVRFEGCHYIAPGKPQVVTLEYELKKGDSIRLSYFGSGYMKIEDAAAHKGPGLAIQSVEIEGPLVEAWPPRSYRVAFGELPFEPSAAEAARAKSSQNRYAPKLQVVSTHPQEDAERLLKAFAPRAFRRPVADAEVTPIIALVQQRLGAGYSFEDAMRVGYKALLTTPQFLFLQEKPGTLDDYALAARLSYFLWSTMPDETLLALASKGGLHKPETLRAQTERLLNDPKARAFTANFTGQWLDLRQIEFTTPDMKLYPEFDQFLQFSMVRETELFFDEVLKHDLPVMNFVHSDFTMLNQRIAEHYGIAGVSGGEFQRVVLKPEYRRGGIMTQASVLKVTANGTNTSPVIRGKWVLDRLLGQPVPPPPKGVPAVEPDIRGATTIREQLDKHRNVESCAVCHVKIDPPGFALENYDVIGNWRERYRSLGEGERLNLEIGGRKVQYRNGPPVDATGKTPDGTAFKDMAEFKRILMQHPDQIARCVAGKLLTYATGAAPQFADREVLDQIVKRSQGGQHGLRTLIHEVIQSRSFTHK